MQGNIIKVANDKLSSEVYIPIFKDKLKLDSLLIKWFGVKTEDVNEDMIIINESYFLQYPQITKE